MVGELVPQVEISKATTMAWLTEQGLSQCLFAGDDLSDVPVFEELKAQREKGFQTLSIGVGSKETPPEITQLADVMVESPQAWAELLATVAQDL